MELSVTAVVIAAAILVALGALASSYVGALQQTVRELQQRIATLEREQSGRPALRVAFDFNATTREALLHVSNDGGDAEVRAPMSIEGALANQLESEVCAAWQDAGEPTTVVRRGQTQALRLAKLDLSVFPYAQWEIYAIGPVGEGPAQAGLQAQKFSLRAMHTSTIGGDPETHAPAMFLQVTLVTSPESVSPPPQCTIVLQPFEAVRLRPLV